MESTEINQQNENLFYSNSQIKDYLLETSRWGKLLAIIGYLLIGIMILIAVAMMIGTSASDRAFGSTISIGYMGFIYLVIALLYYFPATYLHSFSNQVRLCLQSQEMGSITLAFQNLKPLFKFMGIFAIVMICFYGLMILIAVPMMLPMNV
ncbi:MAG TPA: hypothetical protein VIS49_06060 [Cyclobacteriaceae bacterium]